MMYKLDINMIPKKKKLPASVTVGIPFAILIFAALAAAGIILPNLLLQNYKTSLDSLQAKIGTYAEIEGKYYKKLEEHSTMQQQEANYKNFVENKRQTLEVMRKIEKAKPQSVLLTEQIYDKDKVMISGRCTDDIDIARFEVELRKLDFFSEILLGVIDGPDNQRNFNFTLLYTAEPVPTTSTEQTSVAAETEGGNTNG